MTQQTTPRQPVPCDSVAILIAYEAGRRDMADEVLDLAHAAVAPTDGAIYSGEIDTPAKALARVLARLEQVVEDERQ